MPKKLAIIAALGLLLTGCGSSASEAAPAEAYITNDQAQYIQISEPQDETPETYLYCTDGKTAAQMPGEENPELTEEAAAGMVTESQADYFLFTRREQNITDETGMTVLYERYCEPFFSSADSELSRWVNGILDILRSEYTSNSTNLFAYAQEYLEENGSDQFYSYSNYQELGIARHDDAMVSILSLSSLYSGGTHPNAVQTAYNLDIRNRKLLTLEDVIAEAGAETLTELVITGVQEKFENLGEYALFDDYLQTIVQSLTYGTMTPYWYFNDVGLVVFYNQYELGPYAAGIIRVELPYERLDGVLKPEYYPEYDCGHALGNMLMRGDWDGYKKIPITIENDGERLLIGVEGQVFQIQLSEIYWLEQTPIMQEILFSASSMGQNDVLEITGGFTDDGRSFAVSFLNSLGEQTVYYLHTDGISEDP